MGLYRLPHTALVDKQEKVKRKFLDMEAEDFYEGNEFDDKAEVDLMEQEQNVVKRLLENLQEMAPAQMKIQLARFSDINPAKLKREKLRKKLAQVLRAKLSEKESTAPEEQQIESKSSAKTTVKVNGQLAEFFQNKFTHTTHGVSPEGYIESTIHCGNSITCVYAQEEIVRHFIYDNKEFGMSQITGPTLQYTPLSGQKQKKEMLIEFTYELPYEVVAAEEHIRFFLKGPPHFVFEGVKRANIWHRKAISLENLKITRKATRKQLHDYYQQFL